MSDFLATYALFIWVGLLTVLHFLNGGGNPRRLILLGIVGGTMFLPVTGFPITAYVGFNKDVASATSASLGLFLFGNRERITARLGWVDLPMLTWCLAPLLTALFSPGVVATDGITFAISRCLDWGLPYLLGRRYFCSFQALREIATAIFIGGLIYIPFCLLEMRMTPILHLNVYGFMQHSYFQTVRENGYRPMVFMNQGLMLAMWMGAACLCGVWLWSTRVIRRMAGIRVEWFLSILIGTTLLCRSSGAVLLLVVGLVMLYLTRFLRFSIVLPLILAVPVIYMSARTIGNWNGQSAIDLAAATMGEQRSGSLEYRMTMENYLVHRSEERLWFGWGPGPGCLTRFTDSGDPVGITPDGMWILAFGYSGIIGLVSYFATILLPPLLMWIRVPGRFWNHPAGAGGIALAVLLSLVAIDNVLNAMINPVFTLVAGAVTSTAIADIAAVGRPELSAHKAPRGRRRKMNLEPLNET